MKTLDILKFHTDEVIQKTIELLPSALRGDAVNRMFYVKDENGEIKVDYCINLGLPTSTKDTYFIIKNTVVVDPEEYGCNNLNDVDFSSLGWDDDIKSSICMKIEELEMQEMKLLQNLAGVQDIMLVKKHYLLYP